MLTEPVFNFPNVQDAYDEVVFETFEFASYYRTTGALRILSLRYLTCAISSSALSCLISASPNVESTFGH